MTLMITVCKKEVLNFDFLRNFFSIQKCILKYFFECMINPSTTPSRCWYCCIHWIVNFGTSCCAVGISSSIVSLFLTKFMHSLLVYLWHQSKVSLLFFLLVQRIFIDFNAKCSVLNFTNICSVKPPIVFLWKLLACSFSWLFF